MSQMSKEYKHEWYEKNKERLKPIEILYRINNKEKVAKTKKDWVSKNREWCAMQSKGYRSFPANKEKAKVYMNEYVKIRCKNDINFHLRARLRNRLYHAIKGKAKRGSAVRDLGCSIDELKFFLEGKFQQGMSWENYGSWHLDHIKPLASFNLEDKEQFLIACNYKNLQPLWAMENLLKRDKIINLNEILCLK